MSETKTPWTPGPWKAEFWERSAVFYHEGSPIGEWEIKRVEKIDGYSHTIASLLPGKDRAADAHLIAASPAMAEALEDMLAGWKYIRMHHGDLFGVGWDRAQSKAEAALALARGETK